MPSLSTTLEDPDGIHKNTVRSRSNKETLQSAGDIDDNLSDNNDERLDIRATTAAPSAWPSAFVVQVTAMAGLGGILFGYDLGVISGALPQLTLEFGLTSRQQEVCVSILYLGGGVGAVMGGSLCDAFGRKRAILLTDVIFAAGALLLYLATSFNAVVIGRVVVGFAIALSGIADVTYLHEIAPVQFRGGIVSVNEACISLGFLFAFWIGVMLSDEGKTDGWRPMFGCSGIIAAAQFAGMLYMPESPKWLDGQGRHEESVVASRRINSEYILYDFDTVDNGGLTSYQESSPPQKRGRNDSSQGSMETDVPVTTLDEMKGLRWFCSRSWGLVYNFYVFLTTLSKNHSRQASIAIFLAVTQQLCGQANVLSYAPLIFAAASSGTDADTDDWSTLWIGLVKFAVTVLVIWKIEAMGRRLLLLVGMGTIAVGLWMLVLAFAGDDDDNDDTTDEATSGSTWAFPGIVLVVCGYSMSFGPLTWLITSELFATDIRGRALGVSTIVTYLFASLVTFTFLSAQEWLGTTAVFSFYLCMTCLGWVFAYLAIPDTGGKSPKEIEHDICKMPWWQSTRPSSRARTSRLSMRRSSNALSTLDDDTSRGIPGKSQRR